MKIEITGDRKMKEKIKELKKEFKEVLMKESKKYNGDGVYVKIVRDGYLVNDITTTKNGVNTKVLQTTNDPFKAKQFTLNEAIDEYFEKETSEYTNFYDVFSGLGVIKLPYVYGKEGDVFKKYLDLEEDK